MLENLAPSDNSSLNGYIKYYNSLRTYGIIESDGQGYIFFPNSFENYIDKNSLINCKGRSICFVPVVDDGKKIATLVSFTD